MKKVDGRIIGFDPGTARTGYGVLDLSDGSPRMRTCGLIETEAGTDPAERLADLADQVDTILAESKPTAAAVERLFFATNAKTAMAVAEARGVIMLACARAGLDVGEYTPLQVKQSVASFGQADKTQVARMVCRLLGLKETPKPDDVTDALAVALCHEAHLKTRLA